MLVPSMRTVPELARFPVVVKSRPFFTVNSPWLLFRVLIFAKVEPAPASVTLAAGKQDKSHIPPAGLLREVFVFLFFGCLFHGRFPMARLKDAGIRRGCGRSVWSRTEGCSQAFGVLRPTMVLSAKVQSQIGGVASC